MNWLLPALGVAFWGTVNTLTLKALAVKGSGLVIAAGSLMGGGILVSLYLYITQRDILIANISWDNALIVAGISVISLLLNISLISALSSGPVSLVNPVATVASNMLILLGGVVLFRETLSPVALAGVGLAFVSVLMMAKG